MSTQVKRPSPAANADAPFAVTVGIKDADPYVKVLVYGDYGVGKTVMVGSSVDVDYMRDVLLINIEAGTKSIAKSGAVEHHDEISIVNVGNYEQFVYVYDWLHAYTTARDAGDKERLTKIMSRIPGMDPRRKFRTVIIDSLSELESMNMSRILGSDMSDLLQDLPKTEFSDYGKNRNMMHKIIRAYRNLPMHVLVTCSAQWDQDEKKKYGHTLNLTGKLSKDVQGFMDIVGFMQIVTDADGKRVRRLNLQSSGQFDAKSRLTPDNVRSIDEPSMSKLMSRLTRKGVTSK